MIKKPMKWLGVCLKALTNMIMELEKTIKADDALNFDVIVGTGELCGVQHFTFGRVLWTKCIRSI
jgi:hypothetical protein